MIPYRSIQFTTQHPDSNSLAGFGTNPIKERLPNPRPLVAGFLERVSSVLKDIVDDELQLQCVQNHFRARLRVATVHTRDEIAIRGLPERLLGHTRSVAAREQETTDVEGSL